ncbi:MAG: Na+/H+ antiporter NhaA [Pseudomonadota bacterium]
MLTKANALSGETKAGLALAFAAALGVFFENIGLLKPYYDLILTTTATVAIAPPAIEGAASISKPLLLWINDGLMALFFLLIALEIKRELKEGALSSWRQAALPVYGAVGGMVVPAMIFLGIVGIESAEARGWAIPAATDIAFALGVLSFFGKRVPPVLKTFLLALAVVDDLAAIAIIAVFYTADLSVGALGMAGAAIVALVAMNFAGMRKLTPYILVGLVLWVSVLKSGVHATLAGVALGFAIPLATGKDGDRPAVRLEHGLHPWIMFFVMPVFAFANAGVPLGGLTWADMTAPLTLAIASALFIGKQIGVFGFAYGALAAGLAERPTGATLAQLYGVSLLAGIGFTMSLFIGTLAFSDPEHQNAVRLGVLSGSLLSGLAGVLVLSLTTRSQTGSAAPAARLTPAE